MLKTKQGIIINDDVVKYYVSNYGTAAIMWLNNIDTIIDIFEKKWHISIVDSESNVNFTVLLYGKSYIYGDIVLKMIPPFCPRLQREVYFYNELPYSNMAKIVEYDLKLGGFLMQRIHHCENSIKLETVSGLFKKMYEERKRTKGLNQNYSYEFDFFKSINFAKSQIVESKDDKLLKYLPIIEKSIHYYKDSKRGTSLFLIHGDAHSHNILCDNESIYLIDPIGYAGPFEVEYARFIGTYIRENENYIHLSDIIEFFVDKGLLSNNVALAVGYDVTMRACNTFREKNTLKEIVDSFEWARKTCSSVDALL